MVKSGTGSAIPCHSQQKNEKRTEEGDVLGDGERGELGGEEERLLAGALLEQRGECAEGGNGGDGVDSELLLEHLEVVTAKRSNEGKIRSSMISMIGHKAEGRSTVKPRRKETRLTLQWRTPRWSADRYRR